MSPSKRPELYLLLMVAFLAPIIGGQVPTEPMGGASLVGGLSGDASSVAATRLFLGLLAFGSLALSFLRLRAVPLPRGRIVLLLSLFLAMLGGSALLSDFRVQSIEAFLLWVISAGAMLAAIASVGRKSGPALILAALAVSGIVLGGRAIVDYALIKEGEPTYRAFATWNNPNSLAGMLLILGMASLAVCGHREKGFRLIGMIGAFASGAGLALTQSKGGLVALVVGVVGWAVTYLIWKGKPSGLAVAAPLLLGFGVAWMWQTSAIRSVAPGNSGRLLSSGSEAEQSQGFRLLLWKSAAELVKTKPAPGWGPGTFRYESSRPGLQTATAYAHQTYLQIAFEGGIAALILFGLLAGSWFRQVFRGARSLTSEQNAMRAGIVGAVLAFGANGLTESNLAFSGIAVTLFILLGLGIQLGADGSSPELMPASMRRTIVLAAAVVPLCFLVQFTIAEGRKSSLIAAGSESDFTAMLARSRDLEQAQNRVPPAFKDGEALLLAGLFEGRDADRRGRLLEQASLTFPAPRSHRQYARWLAEREQWNTAIAVLDRVFIRDPHNMPALRLLIDYNERAGNLPAAEKAAQDLVAVEQTTYYQVNSLQDLVPLETAEARVWLAKRERDPKRAIDLLKPAVDSYDAYRRRTLPLVLVMSKANLPYAGQSKDEAMSAMEQGAEAAELLQKLAQSSGDAAGAESASSAGLAFREALAGF